MGAENLRWLHFFLCLNEVDRNVPRVSRLCFSREQRPKRYLSYQYQEFLPSNGFNFQRHQLLVFPMFSSFDLYFSNEFFSCCRCIRSSSPSRMSYNSGFSRGPPSPTPQPPGTFVVRGSEESSRGFLRDTNGFEHCMFPKKGPCLFPPICRCLCVCSGSRPVLEPRLLESMVR